MFERVEFSKYRDQAVFIQLGERQSSRTGYLRWAAEDKQPPSLWYCQIVEVGFLSDLVLREHEVLTPCFTDLRDMHGEAQTAARRLGLIE